MSDREAEYEAILELTARFKAANPDVFPSRTIPVDHPALLAAVEAADVVCIFPDERRLTWLTSALADLRAVLDPADENLQAAAAVARHEWEARGD